MAKCGRGRLGRLRDRRPRTRWLAIGAATRSGLLRAGQSPFPLPPRKQPVKRWNAMSWRCTTKRVHAGHWSAVFTDEQINGWLAADLPEKFPQLLPPEIQDPRVVFAPGQLQLACRYTGSRTHDRRQPDARSAFGRGTQHVGRAHLRRTGGTGSAPAQTIPRPCHGVRAQRGPVAPLGPVRWRSSRARHLRRIRVHRTMTRNCCSNVSKSARAKSIWPVERCRRTSRAHPHPPQGNAAKPSPWRKTG